MAWQYMNYLRYLKVKFIKFSCILSFALLGLISCSYSPFSLFNQGDDICIINNDAYSLGNIPVYRIGRKNYFVLKTSFGYKERGIASWYGFSFDGEATSSGELFDMNVMSAAHKTLPIPSWVRVTNLGSGESITVRVNDRGPFVDDRIIDLSRAAAQRLGMVRQGTARVEVEVVPNWLGLYTEQGVNYFAQVGTYRNEQNARNVLVDLREKRFNNVNINTDGLWSNQVYQVRIGPIPDARLYLDIQADLSRNGFENICLVVEKS